MWYLTNRWKLISENPQLLPWKNPLPLFTHSQPKNSRTASSHLLGNIGGGGGDTVRTVARMKILGVRMGANTLIFNKVGTKNKKTWFLVQFYLLFPKTFSKDCPDEILQLRVYNRLLNNSIITIYFAAFSGKILKFEEACSLNRFWVVITVLDFLVWSTHKSLILMVKMFHI